MTKSMRLFLAACLLSMITAVQVLAAEIPPPPAATINFLPMSPLPGKTSMSGAGTYNVPAGWKRQEIKLRIYTVVDGKKGLFVKEADAQVPNAMDWSALAVGLTSDTEYYVEARLKLAPDKVVTFDYAYKTADGGIKKTTK